MAAPAFVLLLLAVLFLFVPGLLVPRSRRVLLGSWFDRYFAAATAVYLGLQMLTFAGFGFFGL